LNEVLTENFILISGKLNLNILLNSGENQRSYKLSRLPSCLYSFLSYYRSWSYRNISRPWYSYRKNEPYRSESNIT